MRAIFASLLSALLVVSAQPPQTQQPAPAAAKGVTRFGTTTQLVVVDVTAKDKSGNPIKNLKPSDFTITEDGKKQDIKVFQLHKLEETPSPEPVPARAPATQAPKNLDAPPVKSVV